MKTFPFGMTPEEDIRAGWCEELNYNFSERLHTIIENALIYSEKFSIFQLTEANKDVLLDVEDLLGLLDALAEYGNAEKDDSDDAKAIRRAVLKAMGISEV